MRWPGFARDRLPARAFSLTLALAYAGWLCADEAAHRLKLTALVEEGDLILEEAHALQPVADKLQADTARVDAEEAAVRAESADLNQTIAKFNAANVELERRVQAHQAECPRESQDQALVESCNARAAELRDTVRAHEQQRPILQQRQSALQQRLEAHNAARRDLAQRKRELDPKIQANRKDADYWLGEARTFLAGEGFRGLAQSAGAQAACDGGQLADLRARPAIEAVERVHACFKAVAASR